VIGGVRLFEGLRPLARRGMLRDALAGLNLATINIPQVLGYSRIAGMPVVTGLYTLLLPPLAFAIFGSSRHLVVAADSPSKWNRASCSRWRSRCFATSTTATGRTP
jgi:MFS superfamily sulfate permease-like transporter